MNENLNKEKDIDQLGDSFKDLTMIPRTPAKSDQTDPVEPNAGKVPDIVSTTISDVIKPSEGRIDKITPIQPFSTDVFSSTTNATNIGTATLTSVVTTTSRQGPFATAQTRKKNTLSEFGAISKLAVDEEEENLNIKPDSNFSQPEYVPLYPSEGLQIRTNPHVKPPRLNLGKRSNLDVIDETSKRTFGIPNDPNK